MGREHFNQRVRCADGFTLSIQARESSYCTPRDNVGPYTHVECGFPSKPPLTKEFLSYAELCGTDDPCETVYPYVPSDVVQAELDAHGGMVSQQNLNSI